MKQALTAQNRRATPIERSIERPTVQPLPAELSSAQAKLVYLYLEAAGGATIDELDDALAMKKLAVLSILSTLRSDGLVERRDDVHVTTR